MKFPHLPESADVLVQTVAKVSALGAAAGWQVWKKSPKASMVYLLGIGAGGDGAQGGNSTTLGGGGGSSGSQAQVLLPACLVPDVLYYRILTAGPTLVSAVLSDTVTSQIFIQAAGGNNASGQTGGTAPAAPTIDNMLAAGAGVYTLLQGQAGVNGGNALQGGSISYPTTGLLVTGGAGGGGGGGAGGYSGGNITASGVRPLGSGGNSANGGVGSHGHGFVGGAFLPSGGAGGWGVSSGAGGAGGGDGGIGCGGGGGGSKVGTGAPGGKGGPGLIVIAQW